jgi:hypothetical protein
LQVLDFLVHEELAGGGADERVWGQVLPVLRRHPGRFLVRPGLPLHEMPLEAAKTICLESAAYDSELVFRAEKICNSVTEFTPVSEVARKEAWFTAG